MTTAFLDRFSGGDPEATKLHARLAEAGALADALADLPPDVFDGLDVRGLNMGAMAVSDQPRKSVTDRCRMIELCGHGDPALTVALPGPSLSMTVLERLGTPEPQNRMLAPFYCDDAVWGAFAVTEPGYGSDAAHLVTRATKVNGGYSLTGEKRFIGNAGRARYVVVFATTDAAKGQFGIRALYVPIPSDGLKVDDTPTMTGMRVVRVSRLTFTDCFVPEENLLGQGGSIDLARSFAYAQLSFDAMRPCLSSLMNGASAGLLDRLRPSRAALASVTRNGIDAVTHAYEGPVSSARLLAMQAARLFDAGVGSAIHASISKVNAQNVACGLVSALLRIPGIEDHPEEPLIRRWWRDFQAFKVMEGTRDVHHLMIARARLAAQTHTLAA